MCDQVVPLHLQVTSLKHPHTGHKNTAFLNQLVFPQSEYGDVAEDMPENPGTERPQDSSRRYSTWRPPRIHCCSRFHRKGRPGGQPGEGREMEARP